MPVQSYHNILEETYEPIIEKHGQLQAHHLMDEPYVPMIPQLPIMYWNILSEGQNTVDFGAISDILQIQTKTQILGEMLKSSGTLGGLLTGVGIQGSNHILAISTCMRLIDEEVSSSRSFKTDRKLFNIYKFDSNRNKTTKEQELQGIGTETSLERKKRLAEKNRHWNKINLQKMEPRRRNLNNRWLWQSLGSFLGTLLLFDKLRKKMLATDANNPLYWEQARKSFAITQTIFHGSQYVSGFFNPSLALTFCLIQANVNDICSRTLGQFHQMTDFTMPVNNSNVLVHNVLLRNSIPYLNKNNKNSSLNNFAVLCYRYLYYSHFSNLDTQNSYAMNIRRLQPKQKDDYNTPYNSYDEYLFKTTGISEDVELNHRGAYISWDSLPQLIRCIENHDLSNPYDKNLKYIYDELISFAEQIFEFVNVYNSQMESQCTTHGNKPLIGDVQKKFDAIINKKYVPFELSPYIYCSNNDGITDYRSDIKNGVIYEVLLSILGGWQITANLKSGFQTYNARTMQNAYIRHYSIFHCFCNGNGKGNNFNTLVKSLVNDYDQYEGVKEHSQPKQDQVALDDYVNRRAGGNIDCITISPTNDTDYTIIPQILSNNIPEQRSRGVFENVNNY